ncbi:MAG: hypothetical protein WDN67_04180 [Candidatus Moraniibacteriota bacterium]
MGDAGILIDPYQPNEILLALQAVLDSRELAATLIARGLKRKERFSWATAAKETRAVFRRLLKNA